MLGNLFSMHQTAARAPVPNLRTVNKLAAALAGLPAPWRVLRNRRASAADGPPWVKYIALHPEKGIALLDLLPANPHAAVAPLDEFLARTGFAAFSHGDPPIVAVALAERDIVAVGDHLADAFAGAPRCGIKNGNWAEAVVELLMSTSGLFLTPVETASGVPKRDTTSPIAAQKPTAAEHVSKPAPSPPPTEDPPQPRRQEPLREPKVSPQGPDPKVRSAAATEPLSKPAPSSPPNEAPRREAAPLSDFLWPPEPSSSRGASAVYVEAPDPDLRVGRPMDFERRAGRRRHPIALLLVAASLSTAAILAVLYVHAPGVPPATTASIEGPPAQATDLPTHPADSAATGTEQPATAPSSTTANIERAPVKTDRPTHPADSTNTGTKKPATASSASPVVPPHPATTPPHAAVAAAPSLPDARTRESTTIPKPAKAEPAPAAVGLAPRREPSVDEGLARPILSPPRTDGRAFGGDVALPPANEETITVDGTTYIKGREPRALGTVTQPEPESGFEPDN